MENLDNPSKTVDSVKLQEQFVQNLNGTSMEEIILFSLQIPLLIFVAILVEVWFLKKLSIDLYKSKTASLAHAAVIFVLETITIILPIVCILTLLSNYLHIHLIFFLIVIQFIIVCNVSSANDYILYWKLPYYKRGLAPDYLISNKQAFVTYFRSVILLATSVSILAVDFNVFPRRFAKTEMYGTSVMDLGVGLFMISNGLVVKPYSRIPFSKSVKKVIVETSILFLLGIGRYLLIHKFDYQNHVTEYGVHWNFFITLGFVKIFSHFLLKISRGYSLFMGIVFMALHQYLLTYSLEEFVTSDLERDTWLKANREGIVSLLGYLSLYQIGIAIGQMIGSLQNKPISNKIKMLIFFIVLSVALYFVTSYVNNTYFRISRCLANLPFILWILTISLSTLSVCLIIELLLVCFMPLKTNLTSDIYTLITPTILHGVNYNGLFFFLISNIFTGLVNLTVDALNTDTLKSIFILIVYMIANCILVFILYLKNIQLKLW